MFRELFALEEEVFKVLASQKRLEIIQLLKNRELNVGEMTSMLGLHQPNLSQHLSLLRQHKLVAVAKRGQKVYYKLTDERIGRAVELIYQFLSFQYNLDKNLSSKMQRDAYPIVQDVVCGMRLSASEAYDYTKYEGHTYYFCASGCKTKFVSNRAKYIKQERGVKV